MDIRIEFAESEGLEVHQHDEHESGYEIAEVRYETEVQDGRRYKHVTITLAETDALVEDEDEDEFLRGYDEGLKDGQVMERGRKEREEAYFGQDTEADLDYSGGLVDPYARVFGLGRQGAPGSTVEFGNRRGN